MNPARASVGGTIALFWLCTALFGLRIAAQAIQYWVPQSWLPPFAAFQGSRLPYGLLLATQLAILAIMAAATGQLHHQQIVPRVFPNRFLRWFGILYLIGSLTRLGMGFFIANASPWFRSWIPAGFHVVLAVFVLALAGCTRDWQRKPTRSS